MAPKIHRWAKSFRQRNKENQRAARSRLLNIESLERRTLLAANVITDQLDYVPGDTAQILATGYQFGETIRFQVLHNDGTPNTGSGHLPWQITDGGARDLDGQRNGQVQTTWYVNPDDSAGSSFILTATGLTSGLTDSTFFTDSSNLDQYSNKPPTHYQNGNLNSSNSAYTEGSSIPYRYLVGDATEDHRVYVDIVYEFQAAPGGPYSTDYLTDDDASEALDDSLRFGPNGPPGDFGLTSCANPLVVPIPGDDSTDLDGTGPIGVGSFDICSSVPITLVAATHEGTTGNTKTIRLVLDLGNDGVADNESDVDFAIFWGGHLARDTDHPGLNNGAGDLTGGSAFHMEVQAFQDNDNSGTRTGGDTNLNTGRVSAQPDVIVDTSMAWEKRRDDTHALQGGATFVVSPNPLTGIGTLTLIDNGFLDADPDPGQILLPDVRFGTYTITEVGAPAGFDIDDFPSRTVTVSITTPVVSVGSQGVIDLGNTNTSDFFNIPQPQITLNKVTVDAATSGDGLTILAGEPITWRYTVTNPSSAELSNVSLVDDQLGNITSFTGDSDGDGKLDPGEVWVFSQAGVAAIGSYNNSATVSGSYTPAGGTPTVVQATDTSSYFGANPQIAIDKVTTHGSTAGDGITVNVGEVVGWRYTVTNAGNVPLANVTVIDSVPGVSPAYVSGDADADGLLDLGETWRFTASGIAVAGGYSNTGTASGSFTDTAGHTGTDTASDDSSYFGGDPRIKIVKVTIDGATSGDGLTILTGEAITWQYTVTNLGNTSLLDVTVTDDGPGVVPLYQSGDTDHDGRLDTTETWIYTASGTAIEGNYTNNSTVEAVFIDSNQDRHPTSGADSSSYFGATPSISIDKVTQHGSAEGDGLNIVAGEAVSWQYTVTNTGNVPLSNISVTDSKAGVTPTFVSGDTDGDAKLDRDETWIYTASGTAIIGDYSNTGTASGNFRDDAGHTRTDSDSDSSSYFGANPQINIVKVTQEGAVSGDGITVLTGELISWQYTVTNTGNVPLANVTVNDVPLGPITSFTGDTNNNQLLDLTETWVFTFTGTAAAGTNLNTGTARGTYTDSARHVHDDTASDGSSYFGANPQIAIVKDTIDGASSGDGADILVGEAIQWRYTVTNAGNVPLSNVTVTDSHAGVTPVRVSGDTNGNNELDLTETWIYTASSTAIAGDYANTGTASGRFTDDAKDTRSDTASDASSYFGANPQIAIDKQTRHGSTSGDGLTIEVGESLSWRYAVSNLGNVPLSNVTVTDSQAGVTPVFQSGDTDGDGELDQGETWIYVANGTAVAGNYTNTGTATGDFTDTAGHTRADSATDDSSYFGGEPQIEIEKVTVDGGSEGDGRTILSGEAIIWRYTVTNEGTTPLFDVTVTDSQPGVTPVFVSGDTNGDNRLDTTETWIYEATGIAQVGNYVNNGQATAVFIDSNRDRHETSAADASSYFGADPQISIEKVTEHGGVQGDALRVVVGEAISWRYTVTNTGNVSLANVTVTDSEAGVTPTLVSGDDNSNNRLDLGETWIYTATGTAVQGSYANTGTASGQFTDAAGHTRSDTEADGSSYFGANPQIHINKVTVDGGSAGDGRSILVGEAITWRYEVTNTGNVALSNVNVTDSVGGVTPAYLSGDDGNGKLDPKEKWIFTAGGIAAAGTQPNTGTARGDYIDSASHVHFDTDSDDSSYFGADPQIAITKVTLDGATAGDGLDILVGESIRWRYTVTNAGNVPLSNVIVTDGRPGVTPVFQSGDANGNSRLDVGEVWTYIATGTAVAGNYTNVGWARGRFTDTAGHTRSDSANDASSYFGANPQIAINKVTVDGPSAGDGRSILVGENIRWRYTVTNAGNVPLANVTVTDSEAGVTPVFQSGDANGNNLLDRGETWFYTADGNAAAGSYSNTGTARGSFADTAGHARTDTATDNSSYFGANPQIAIDKVTVDGTTAGDGLDILVGKAIAWRYTVTNAGNVPLANIVVTDGRPGVTPVFQNGDANGNSRLDVGEIWTYIATGTAVAGNYTNVGWARGRFTDAAGHTRSDSANDASSYFGANAQIAINKVTVDGPSAGDGRSILVGENIRWRYTVTNVGNVPLANVTVTDSEAGVTPVLQSGDANGNNLLDVGETWFYTADGTATAGSYSNTGTATGSFRDTARQTVTDTAADDSSYFGANPQIAVNKVTVDGASAGDGRRILVGEPIRWRYTVTNVGNVSVTNVSVTDSQAGVTPVFQSGDANGNNRLDRGEVWTYIATGTAVRGSYANTGTAQGSFTDAAGHARADQSSDPSSYFGIDPSIDIQKLVNGQDADAAPGPTILFGSPVVWTYVVRNTGNAPLAGVAVTDDNGTPGDPSDDFSPTFQSGDFDGDGLLDVNETWRYRATGTAMLGAYRNLGTVTASVTDTAQHLQTVADSDPANYRGHRNVIVIVPDKGNQSTPLVRVIDRDTQQVLTQFLAYESSFRGGVRIATGDLDGDGVDEIITAPQRGRAPEIRVFEQDGTELVKYRTMAYSPTFLGGVNIAVGDVDGNQTTDIVAAPNYGAMPVEVFYNNPAASDPIPNTPSRSFFAFSNQFLGGADVAVADVGTFANGSIVNALAQDGKAEIIVGSGPGMSATVKVYDLTGAPAVVDTISPLGGSFTGGMSLQAGRVNGDAIPDILVAAGDLGGSQIEIWSGIANDSPDVLLDAFAAFADVSSSNVHVHAALLDQNGDGRADGVLAAQGTNGTSGQLRFFNVDGSGMQAWSGYPGGWLVANVARPSPSLPSAITSTQLSLNSDSAKSNETELALDDVFNAWGASEE